MCSGWLTRDFVRVGGQDAKTGLACRSLLLALAVCGVWRLPREEAHHGVVCDVDLCFENQVHFLCFEDQGDIGSHTEQANGRGGIRLWGLDTAEAAVVCSCSGEDGIGHRQQIAAAPSIAAMVDGGEGVHSW
jgi:hypothetical protein